SCVALNIIRSIDHDQPQKKFQISLARFSIADFRLEEMSMSKRHWMRGLVLKSKTCPEPSRRIENRKWVGIIALVVAIGMCGARVEAQQAGKVFRIGFLDNSTASGIAVLLDVFRQELSKLGWIEGKNITIEYRFAEQKNERLPELAADLVRLKVDLIVTSG